MAEFQSHRDVGASTGSRMHGHGGKFTDRGITVFRNREALLFLLAILPGLLLLAMANRSCWQSAHSFLLDSFPKLGYALNGMKGRIALFIGLLLQVSAFVWIETSFLHIWIKRRIRKNADGPMRGGRAKKPMHGKETFGQYVGDSEPDSRA